MYSFVIIAACLAVAAAGLVPVTPLVKTTVVEGPSVGASVVGPDGSAIVSTQPAGRIVVNENVGVATVGYSAPVIAHGVAASTFAYHAAPLAYSAPSIPAVAYASPYAKTIVNSPIVASGYPLLA